MPGTTEGAKKRWKNLPERKRRQLRRGLAAGNVAISNAERSDAAKRGWRNMSLGKRTQALKQLGIARRQISNEHYEKLHAAPRTALQLSSCISAMQLANKRRYAAMTAEERRTYMVPALVASFEARRLSIGPINIEKIVASLLDELGIAYEVQVPIGKYCADFLIPEQGLVVECDGTYWHSKSGAAARDARKDLYLQNNGYRVLRLPEKEINGLSTADLQHQLAVRVA